ncbi:aldehyde dehydrogenase family protein [Haladaptatus sp. NG-SE-30]
MTSDKILTEHEEARDEVLSETEYGLLINGEWRMADACETMETINPMTGETLATFQLAGEGDVDAAVKAARAAFESEWDGQKPVARARPLERIADALENQRRKFATMEALDVGKPVLQAMADVNIAAESFRYFASLARTHEDRNIPLGSKKLDYVVRQPYGVVGQVNPWNFPLMEMAWKTAPALAAGNTVVLKPPERAPVSSLEFAKIMDEYLPEGTLNLITGIGEVAGDYLSRHPDVDKFALTGSTETGKQVMRNAAEQVTPITLELGGKSPNIVFPDANLDEAVTGAMMAIFLNQGEMCTAGSRLFVHEDIADEFLDQFAHRTQNDIVLNDPLSKETNMGPLIDESHRDRVLEYIETGREEGAAVRIGGGAPEDSSLADAPFVEPTILTNVTNDMTVAREEIFGPVVVVMTFTEYDEVIKKANDTRYGLAAGIWTTDFETAHQAARDLDAGTVWVNTYSDMTDMGAPFGGYKESGIGRELGAETFDEYTQSKNIKANFGRVPDPFSR